MQVMGMDDLKQQWVVTLEEKHEPFTVIGGQRGGGKIFFLENMVKFLEEQLKQEKTETERWKSAALYYADKLGSARNLEVVRCKDCKWYRCETNHYGTEQHFCNRHSGLVCVNENTFCSYGERKDNG